MSARLDPKPPKDLPSVGERVCLRGRSARGTLREVNALNSWAKVEWAADARGPLIVHHWELERESGG